MILTQMTTIAFSFYELTERKKKKQIQRGIEGFLKFAKEGKQNNKGKMAWKSNKKD